MPVKTSRNGIHSQRLKDIRPFVNFNYDLRNKLTRAQQSKIKKYHDEIGALKARPFQVYRPRKAANLKAAQSFAQHEKKLPGLKVAFVPTNGKDKLKITIGKTGKVKARTKYVTTEGFTFNPELLALDAEKEVARVIKGDDSTHYAIRAGRYEIPKTATPDQIGKEVARLQSRYAEGGARFDRPGHINNHWRNWLHGLNGYKFHNQADSKQYMEQKLQAKKELQKDRKRCAIIKGNRRCKKRSGHSGKHKF